MSQNFSRKGVLLTGIPLILEFSFLLIRNTFRHVHSTFTHVQSSVFCVPKRVQICTRIDRPTGARVQKMRARVQKVRAWVQKVSGEDSWVQKIIRSDAPLPGWVGDVEVRKHYILKEKSKEWASKPKIFALRALSTIYLRKHSVSSIKLHVRWFFAAKRRFFLMVFF